MMHLNKWGMQQLHFLQPIPWLYLDLPITNADTSPTKKKLNELEDWFLFYYLLDTTNYGELD